MRYDFTIGKWDIEFTNRSMHKWTHFKTHRFNEGQLYVVWGPLTVMVEDWTAETYALCAQCDSTDIGEVGYGDEGLTVCSDCQSVEQGYKYVNKREFERMF
jgi:hypothetical protein